MSTELDAVFNGETTDQTPVVEAADGSVTENMASPNEEGTEQSEVKAEDAQLETAAKSDDPAPETKEPVMVPIGVVQELREELRQLKNPQKPGQQAPVPDVLEDPDGFNRHMSDQQARIAMNVRLDMSEELAVQTHGREAVDEAFNALKMARDPAAYQNIMASKMPYNALVQWYTQQKVVQEIGSDPDKWREEQRAVIRKEIEAELAVGSAREKAAEIAPSLAGLNGNGGGAKTAFTGPTPLDAVLPE